MSCCYKKWLLETDEGREKMNKAVLKAVSPRLSLEKAKTDRDYQNKISMLLKAAKDACHAYIRSRDRLKPCISCGNPWHEDFDAGHFYKAELFSGLRYDEKNISGQCRKCNRFNDGNESGYRVGIIERYGMEHLDYLDEKAAVEKQQDLKWNAEELREIRKKYVRLFRELLKVK